MFMRLPNTIRAARRTMRLCLAALSLAAAAPVLAADLDYPYQPADPAPARVYREERIEEALPPPPPRASIEPRFVAGPRFAPPAEECRIIVERRIDVDGDEVERRVRICEDAPVPRPHPHYRPSLYDPDLSPPAEIPGERLEAPPRW